jgi:hypothetical protein
MGALAKTVSTSGDRIFFSVSAEIITAFHHKIEGVSGR